MSSKRQKHLREKTAIVVTTFKKITSTSKDNSMCDIPLSVTDSTTVKQAENNNCIVVQTTFLGLSCQSRSHHQNHAQVQDKHLSP